MAKDTDIKRRIYAENGIPEYWIADLQQHRLLIFRTPQNGDYQDQQIITAGEIAPLAFQNISISVPRLLH
ncbi:Uma2 family endonuclease [Spirulina sp. 06S082]|uniref:Uma2 family endonuclease n=1 Tax=Spirulina sp. 06S082 TaxID=3110248 RepID=UPI002B212CCE|nr:Uma2 family endonuclease [Spirulina sp. 06S082]MEA5470251.1 Uma2 family endonuclease [Spirulina sp. 06S082]